MDLWTGYWQNKSIAQFSYLERFTKKKIARLFPSFIIASLQGGQIINEVASNFFLFQPNYVTNFPIHTLIFNQKFQIRLQKDFEPNIYASNDLNVFATFAKLSLFQTLFYVCVKQWSNLVAFSVVLFAPFWRAWSTVQWNSIGWIYSSSLQNRKTNLQKLLNIDLL